jgi:hypothetical protein
MVRISGIALMVLLLTGCRRENMDDCFTSMGPLRSEVRAVGTFALVDLDDRIDLVLENRGSGTVQVEAGRNLLGQVRTEVVNGVLRVRNDNRCNWVRSFKERITVRVPVQEVQQLTLRGTGDVWNSDTIRHEEFRVEQWGAMGTVRLGVSVQRIYIGLHTGAGDVVLTGRAMEFANYYADMLGSIDATGLIAPLVNVNNSGVGDFRCHAEVELNVAIRDAGDVYYTGDPLLNSTITGTGRVVRLP